MIYVLIGIFMALVFALCFLTDKLLQRLSKRADLGIGQSKVRLARANVIFGVILAVAGVALLLFFAARLGPAFYVMAAIIILLGLYLLLNYFMTGIDYSAEGFVYRRPGQKAQAFTYDQIRGQRSFANRAGINVMLYVGQEEVNLYSSMNGAQNFMRAAFNGWCKSRGLEPDESLAPNPGNMIWFPEPGDGAEAEEAE